MAEKTAPIPDDLKSLYRVACDYSTIDGRLMAKQDAKEYKKLIERIAEAEQKFTEHIQHVGRFLSDMYAIMVDPVEDGPEKIAELCQLLRTRAAEDRETARERVERIAESESTFNLRWNADMRAIKIWQAAHPGNDLVWPDRADMVVWMLAELKNALAANEQDRTRLHRVIREIDEEITGRMWLIEGRGSYEWDDDRYKQEFGWAVKALQEKLEPLRKIAGDLKNSPTTQAEVDEARAAIKGGNDAP